MKKIALEYSDFKTLIDNDNYFVDKTLLIKEFLDDSSQVILIPRPRRFGKTLNLSMIRYFVEKCDEDTRYLFNNLLIEKEEEIMKRQGIYPTIYLTFKDEKHKDFDSIIERIKWFVTAIYNEHKEVYSILKDKQDIDFFNKIIDSNYSIAELELALKNLCKYLYEYHGEKVIVLIDEYDTPIQHSYFSGIYDETISFMRNFLSNTLKDNIYLEKAMLTGILRVARESGYGRYDVMIIPKDIKKPGIIIEFKRARKTNKKSIQELIEEAKNQIEDKKYEMELLSRGITNIKKLVIVFKGKEVFISDVS